MVRNTLLRYGILLHHPWFICLCQPALLANGIVNEECFEDMLILFDCLNFLFSEARAINKSLSALGDVVAALTSGESFIPYRNHKLTELMRDSLGGNAKTLMVVNVSPLASDSVETRNSLEYATRVKQVRSNHQPQDCSLCQSTIPMTDSTV